MIQYIIAAGIGAFLGSQSKKSKKTYAHGGEVDIMLTDDDLGYYSILHKGEFIEKDFQSKKEAENWARENNYTYAEGGIMADGRLVLGSSYGVGGNKNKTYKLIKDDRDSDGKPYYEVVEHPSNSVMAQGDDFVEVNNMYKIFTGKQ